MQDQSLLTIDGSYGEGGGQILRTSLTLSVLTGRPIEITKIRAGRSKPGLQPQHLASVRAAAALSAADSEGAEIGSTRLRFTPQAMATPGSYHFDIGTAGAVTLVAQTILLPLAWAQAPSHVTLVGGTHVPHAPTTDYLNGVYGRQLAEHGLQTAFSAPNAGFTPRGGGQLHLLIKPNVEFTPVTCTERGAIISVTAQIMTAHLPPDVAARGEAALRERLRVPVGELRVEKREAVSLGPGAAIILIADCEGSRAGFSAIGARGRPMEAVAAEAFDAFDAWRRTGAACDEHLADQLALPMALTPGISRWTTSRVTEHLRTMLWLLPQFLSIEAALDENKDGSGTVRLQGVPLAPNNGGRRGTNSGS